MKYFKKPVNFETVSNVNMVVGHYAGKAIIKTEDNRLYFIECDENCCPVGTVIEDNALTSIYQLENIREREAILNIFD